MRSNLRFVKLFSACSTRSILKLPPNDGRVTDEYRQVHTGKSLGFCRGSYVEGQMSRVESKKSKVEGKKSREESRGSPKKSGVFLKFRVLFNKSFGLSFPKANFLFLVAAMLKKMSLSKHTQHTVMEIRAYTSVYKNERVLKNETDIKSLGQKFIAQPQLPEWFHRTRRLLSRSLRLSRGKWHKVDIYVHATAQAVVNMK